MSNECQRLQALARMSVDAHPGGLKGYFAELKSLAPAEHCVERGLFEALEKEDWDALKTYTLAAYYSPSLVYVVPLGQALRVEANNVNYEDLIEALGATRSPSAVPYIEEALHSDHEWDEYHHFKVKCVWALGEIADPSAIEVLQGVASTGVESVREAAIAELSRIGAA